MKKQLIKIFACVLSVSITVSCATTSMTKKTETDNVMIELQKMADAANRALPNEIIKGVRSEKVFIEANRTVVYTNTILNVSKDIAFDEKTAKSTIMAILHNSPQVDVKDLIKKDIKLKYIYLTEKKEKIAEILISPEDLKQIK